MQRMEENDLIQNALRVMLYNGDRDWTAKQLGERLGLNAQDTLRLVMKLEELGLINHSVKTVSIHIYKISGKGEREAQH